jgi:Tol biopolymer transport system component
LIGWSSSGNELLLASVEKGSLNNLQPEVSLINVEIASGKRREIVKLKDTYLYNIHLSPDKKTIAFTAHREEKDNLWLMSVTGGEAKKITANNDSRLYFSSLAWSPDSNSIFFGKQSRYSLLSMLTDFK